MRVTMKESHGVYARGITYALPNAIAADFLARGVATREETRPAADRLQKVMRPDQVRRRNG